MTDQLARAGDFDTAYRRWYPDVFRYVRRRVGDDRAGDVTADVFVVAWRRQDKLLAADHQLAWLYGVAKLCISNAHRGKRRRGALVERAIAQPYRTAHEPDVEVIDALDRLPAADRDVLTLVAWEGLAGAELAAALGCSEPAARKRLSRARARLQEALEGGHRA